MRKMKKQKFKLIFLILFISCQKEEIITREHLLIELNSYRNKTLSTLTAEESNSYFLIAEKFRILSFQRKTK